MQFSLKSIIHAVVIVSVMCGIFFAWPEDITIFVPFTGLASILTAFLVCVIVFDKAYGRAFAIGALACFLFVSCSLTLFSLDGIDWEDLRGYKIRVGLITMLIPVGGLTGMLTLWCAMENPRDESDIKTNGSNKQSRLSQIIMGLVLGMILAGAIGFTGTFISHQASSPDAPFQSYGGVISP